MHPGQHVVYIGKGKMRKCIPLQRGKVYTIRALWTARDGTPLLYLEEIINRQAKFRDGYCPELGYKRSSFRPLKKLSVEDFLETKEPVHANA